MVKSNVVRMNAAKQVPTLSEVWGDYKSIRRLKPTTLKIYEAVLMWGMEDWVQLPMTDITRGMCLERHAALSSKPGPRGSGHACANSAFRTLRMLFNYAMHRYRDDVEAPLVTANPVRCLSDLKAWNKNVRRQNALQECEMHKWYQAVRALSNLTERDYLILLLFTGLRRSEAANLKWSDVDFAGKFINIRTTKNGKPHTLPLAPLMMQMLSIRYWYFAPSPKNWVFPGRYNCSPISTNSKGYELAFEEFGRSFQLHELRRTFLTTAESLDIPHYTLKKLANHSSGGDVTAGYLIISPERLRQPMERIEAKLLDLTGAQLIF